MNKLPPDPDRHCRAGTRDTFELPQHWSAEQAFAVWEVLDALSTLLWKYYESPLLEQIQLELYEQYSDHTDLCDPEDDIPF